MELRLHLLESFQARGADGAQYKVCGYERLAPDLSLGGGDTHWESTGQVEYRLASGERVEVAADGSMRIAGSGVRLEPVGRRTAVSP